MKLAVNYSPQADALLDSGQIDFEVYKCPDWADMIADARQRRPVYIHFPLKAGLNKTVGIDWRQIEGWLTTTGTLYVNMHLAPRALDFEDMPLDTTDPAHTERLRQAMLEDIERVVQQFGKERVILENVPWDPDPKYAIPRPAIDPDFIRGIIVESGCGLLLDIAHASIAAKFLGMDERDYITRLPLDRIREVHITGLKFTGERRLWEDHHPMTDPDWALLDWAMQHIHSGDWGQPWAVALEYGGSGPLFAWRSESRVLASDVPRMYAMTHPIPSR